MIDGQRILLVDDHELVRASLRVLLEKLSPTAQVIGEASNGREAVRLVRLFNPDLVIMDLNMPELNGIEATRQIMDFNPAIRVLALSMHDEPHGVEQMLRAGASGYVLKQSPVSELTAALAAAIDRRVYLSPRIAGSLVHDYLRWSSPQSSPKRTNGDGHRSAFTALSRREREVLQLLAEGKTSKEIGAVLHVGVKTVESHRGQIMTKLNLRSIAQLTKYAVREGITSC
ncbi:MAG TPA: response regulator transcription factor [Tepidisphaeraceae bacterium]|nr:response regulator transcription factor [Tepidisphaeraceae bacterium]